MSDYLLSVSVGPVQGFIAAARRTRDLWLASNALSEVSRAAARALVDAGAELIFPALRGPDSAAGMGIREPGPTSAVSEPVNVANKMLARVRGSKPSAVSERAREAAEARWRELAEEARQQAAELGVAVDLGRWEEQVGDVIEFYAAWVPLDGESDYARAYARVECLLAGRKALRDFAPACGHAGVPKSSLDGARETVINPATLPPPTRARAGRLKETEHLDAVGVVKRFGGGTRPFPPVCRVAADPWIWGVQRADKRAAEALGRIRTAAAELRQWGLVSAVRSDGPYADFPFEGEVLFRSRLRELLDEAREFEAREGAPTRGGALSGQPLTAPRLSTLVKDIDRELKTLTEDKRSGGMGFGEPLPYLAVLVGDGDRMGAAISRLTSMREHQAFSWRVAQFADQARGIVARHHGCLVFSGGDDVLAFLPVDTCLGAAKRLRDAFTRLMGEPVGNDPPTFSVGIGIGHYLEPLEDLLTLARDAERDAKGTLPDTPRRCSEEAAEPGRNALAVWLKARAGGEPVRVRARWTSGPVERLLNFGRLYLEGSLPDRAAYDLRHLAGEYRGLLGGSAAWREGVGDALVKDARRILKRKTTESGTKLAAEVVDELLRGVAGPETVARVADELVLARHLAAAMRQAPGRWRLEDSEGCREGLHEDGSAGLQGKGTYVRGEG